MKKYKLLLNKKLNVIKKYFKDLGKNKKKKFTLISVALIVVLLLVAYINASLFVASMVNGKPIFRWELIKNLEKQGGEQVLDSLVTRELIKQETNKAGITISNSDIDNEIKKIEDEVVKQGSTLDAMLALQNQDRDSLKEDILLRLQVEKLLSKKITINDDEAKKYFDENADTLYKDQKFEDVKDLITDQLKQQKLSQEFQTWITEIKSNSKINTLLNFK